MRQCAGKNNLRNPADLIVVDHHGLTDTQPGSPHDERRHPGAANAQSRQGVQEPLDLLGIPVVRNYRMGTFTPKVPIRSNSEAARKVEHAVPAARRGPPGGPKCELYI